MNPGDWLELAGVYLQNAGVSKKALDEIREVILRDLTDVSELHDEETDERNIREHLDDA